MHPNPYESPHEAPAKLQTKRGQHPLTRIAVLVVLAIATILAIGIMHGIFVEIFIYAPARKRGALE